MLNRFVLMIASFKRAYVDAGIYPSSISCDDKGSITLTLRRGKERKFLSILVTPLSTDK